MNRGNNTLACIAYGSVVCLHPLVHPLVVILCNCTSGQSEKNLSRIELFCVVPKATHEKLFVGGLSDADAKYWVKTEQKESINYLLSNSLEYSMSIFFCFLHWLIHFTRPKTIQCSD